MRLRSLLLPMVVSACFILPLPAQPVWDDCATPLQIVNFPSVVPYNTLNTAPTPSLAQCPNMGGDLWYKVVAPINGLLEVRHNFNPTQHAVYVLPGGTGCPTDLDLVYCDSPSNQNKSYTPTITGEIYLIQLSGYQGGNVSGSLTVNVLPPPANDLCQSPQVLNLPDVVNYNCTGATPTPGLACPVNRDIWFETTPTLDGLISVDANPNNEATAFGVDVAVYLSPFPGACPTDAELVTCQGTDSLSFAATAGVTYAIRVGFPYGDDFASALLAIDQSFSPPANDDCANPQPVTIPSTTPFDTTGATPGTTGLVCDMNDDLWYSFVASGTGQVHIELGTGNYRHQVYRLPAGAGTCPTDFDVVSPCWQVDESWSDITAGETYAIRVGQSQPGPTAGTMSVEFVAALTNDECTAPIVLPIPGTSTVTTLGASPDATGLGCLSNADSWYRFTVPTTGLLHLEFSDYVYIGVYQDLGGCPTDAEQIYCDDLIETLIPVTSGQQLFLRLSTFNAFPPITTDLFLEILQTAVNDDCALGAALPVTVPTPAPVAWDNFTATDDVNGFSCAVGRDLWYSFTAPTTGCIEFFSPGDGRYAVYLDPTAGTGCPAGPAIECFLPALGQPDRFDFPVTAGQSYLLRVGGYPFQSVSGSFSLEYILCPPSSVVCDIGVPDQITGSFTVPAATTYDLGVQVRINGALQTTLPPGVNSFTQSLPVGFTGVLQVGFTGLSSTLGASEESRCAAAVGAVANNDCVNAQVATIGSNPVDNTIAVIDPTVPFAGCQSYYQSQTSDVWFEFTSPLSQLYTFGVCSASFTARLDLLDGSTGCPSTTAGFIDCTYGCSISAFLTAGEIVLIRVVGVSSTAGVGTLEIAENCAQVSGFTCSYDCGADTLSFTWTGGLHDNYRIDSSTGVVATGLTGDTFVLTNPSAGPQNYQLTGFCPNGSSTTASCATFVVDLSAPSPHLVLDLDGLYVLTPPWGIDSGELIAAALQGLGESVAVLAYPDFDQFPCIDPLLAAAETIWVATGTFSSRYTLSEAEGNLLASLAASGRNIYLEGADHWGTFHTVSQLDLRDGVEANLFGNIEEGDDSLTAMTGLDSGLPEGDFSVFGVAPYIQPALLDVDSNDWLVVSGTDTTGMIPPDPDVTAGAIWVNFDDTLTGEPPYIVAIAASHSDGGRMISSSFEVGGLGVDPVQLVAAYRDFLEYAPTLPHFRRGDANADQLVNIADAIYLLGHLFPVTTQNPIVCRDAADANNDGSVNIADVVHTLDVLFGVPPSTMPMPYPACGTAADAPLQTGIDCLQSICP